MFGSLSFPNSDMLKGKSLKIAVLPANDWVTPLIKLNC